MEGRGVAVLSFSCGGTPAVPIRCGALPTEVREGSNVDLHELLLGGLHIQHAALAEEGGFEPSPCCPLPALFSSIRIGQTTPRAVCRSGGVICWGGGSEKMILVP